MKNTLLITCGCSWTFGVGVGYTPNMTKEEYRNVAWDITVCNRDSFRGILSNKYGLETLNFAHGQASNQRQFRLIKNYLASKSGLKARDEYNIVVLHGITSTARNEMYINEFNSLKNFKYDDPAFSLWSNIIVKHFYDHNNEVSILANEMNFMNTYYDACGIKNIWFDTFNHHDYPINVNNLLEPGHQYRDLLSSLAVKFGFNDFEKEYHKSSWVADSSRIKFLLEQGLVNPHSLHPTKQGHIEIADIIGKQLEQIL